MRFSTAIILSLLELVPASKLRAQDAGHAPKIVITASAAFSRISPADAAMEFRFNYKYPTAYLVDPPKTYLCAFDAMTYLITTPDGRLHSVSLKDTKKDAGYFISASFNLDTPRVFDSIGVKPGLLSGKEAERRFYWREAPRHEPPGGPGCTRPGTRRGLPSDSGLHFSRQPEPPFFPVSLLP